MSSSATQRAACRKWRAKNRERIAAYNRRYRAENPELVAASVRSWAQRHKGAINLLGSKRRARIRGNTIAPVTAAGLKAKFAYHGDSCRHCGATANLQADHIIPLARGGPHCLANIQPLCRSCNTSKGAR